MKRHLAVDLRVVPLPPEEQVAAGGQGGDVRRKATAARLSYSKSMRAA
ncbi:hypothetical protein [Microbispora siamensis]|nr:hypothetical protein [Microbispora siamensis]